MVCERNRREYGKWAGCPRLPHIQSSGNQSAERRSPIAKGSGGFVGVDPGLIKFPAEIAKIVGRSPSGYAAVSFFLWRRDVRPERRSRKPLRIVKTGFRTIGKSITYILWIPDLIRPYGDTGPGDLCFCRKKFSALV